MICKNCEGTGLINKAHPEVCPKCKGTGRVEDAVVDEEEATEEESK